MPYSWPTEKKEKFRDTWNEELAKIARGERPLKVKEIADLFETTATSLKHHVKSLNLKNRPNGNTVFREVSEKKLECMKKMWATNKKTGWTEDKKEQLRRLYCVDLLSREDIAAKLEVSVNAVVGQTHRMNLKRPANAIVRKVIAPKEKSKPVLQIKHDLEDKLPRQKIADKLGFSLSATNGQISRMKLTRGPQVTKTPLPPSFEGCQAVVGRTMQTKIAVRCCVPTLAGKDFCAEHWRTLYAGFLPPALQRKAI